MTAEYNFVRVLYALFEPHLKLCITAAVPYEANSRFEIRIDHDPEIDPAELTMPPPPWLARRWAASSKPPQTQFVPFRSENSTTVTSLYGRIERTTGRIKYVLMKMSRGFAYDALKIEEAVEPLAAGGGFELLHQSLKAAIALPFWDEEAELRAQPGRGAGELQSPPPTIGIYLERAVADELAANSSFSFDETLSGDVLLVEREARQ